jgi:hypothetical protein
VPMTAQHRADDGTASSWSIAEVLMQRAAGAEPEVGEALAQGAAEGIALRATLESFVQNFLLGLPWAPAGPTSTNRRALERAAGVHVSRSGL